MRKIFLSVLLSLLFGIKTWASPDPVADELLTSINTLTINANSEIEAGTANLQKLADDARKNDVKLQFTHDYAQKMQTINEVRSLLQLLEMIVCQLTDLKMEIKLGGAMSCYITMQYNLGLNLIIINGTLISSAIVLMAAKGMTSFNEDQSVIKNITENLQNASDLLNKVTRYLHQNNMNNIRNVAFYQNKMMGSNDDIYCSFNH